MIIFLFGKDTFRLAQKVQAIKTRYTELHKSALNLERFDGEQTSFQDFLDSFNQQSMFVEKKLFFLENFLSSENFGKEFLKKMQDFHESNNVIVICERQEPRKTNKLFKELEKTAKTQEFSELTETQLKNWAIKEFEKYKARISAQALDMLIASIGSDLWKLNSEIKKMASYTKDVKLEHINLFVKKQGAEAEIFKTIEAIAGGNKKRALQMLKNHIEKGDSPFYLLTMIAFQFRNLLLVKDSTAGTVKGMHPFVFRKTSALARNFTKAQLSTLFQKIFQTDLAIKTGKISPEHGINMFVAEL